MHKRFAIGTVVFALTASALFATAPDAPTPVGPGSTTTGSDYISVSTFPVLFMLGDTSAINADVQIYQTSNNQLVYDSGYVTFSNLGYNSIQVSASAVASATDYYWIAYSKNGQGQVSAASTKYHFTAYLVPAQPSDVSPGSILPGISTVTIGSSLQFSVSLASSPVTPTGFSITLTDTTKNTSATYGPFTGSTATLPSSDFIDGDAYSWSAIASANGQNSSSSNPYYFTAKVTPTLTPQTITVSQTTVSGAVGDQFTITASGSSTGYIWAVPTPDITVVSSTDGTEALSFTKSGTYIVTVYAPANSTYAESNTEQITITVQVSGGAPSNLATISGAASISLSWTDNALAETGFSVERKAGSTGTYAEIGKTARSVVSYVDNSVSSGVTYYYRVRALYTSGYSGYSNEVSAAIGLPSPPGAPTPLGPGSTSGGSDYISVSSFNITFMLGDTSAPNANVQIFQSSNNQMVYESGYISFSNLGTNSVSVPASNVTSGTNYYWVAYSKNGSGQTSAASTRYYFTAYLVPAQPSVVSPGSISAGVSTVTVGSSLQFSVSLPTTPVVATGFSITLTDTTKNTSATYGPFDGATASLPASDFVNGDSYSWTAVAVANGAQSSASVPYYFTATVTPTLTPQTITVSQTTASASVGDTLTITASGGNTDYIWAVPTPDLTIVSANGGKEVLSCTKTGTFIVSVYASASGNYAQSNTQQITITVQLSGGAPSDLTAVAGSNSVALSWTDNSLAETGFSVERKSGSNGTYAEVAKTARGIASFVDNGVSAGVTYFYRTRAIFSMGFSPYSNEVSAGVAPPTNSSLKVTVSPTGSQTFDWEQSSTYAITVTDSSGKAVGGASVSVADQVMARNIQVGPTDSNGRTQYTTTVPRATTNGSVSIAFWATKGGYDQSSSVSVTVQVAHNSSGAIPTISVLSPSPGEALVAGNSAVISWQVSGPTSAIDTFDLLLSTDGGSSFTSLVPTNRPNAGSRSWTWSIPSNLHVAGARIQVRALNGSGVDFADDTMAGSFAITGASSVGSVAGSVLDPAGAAVSGASVSVGSATSQTDSGGHYSITGIAPGSVDLSASKSGYIPVHAAVNVAANSATVQNITLHPVTASQTTPLVVDVNSRWFSSTRHVYILDRISLLDTLTATVDWRGLTPGRIVWTTPSGATYTSPQRSSSITIDLGTAIGAGGKLQVQAFDNAGNASNVFTANCDVIPSPIPTLLLSPDLGSDAGNSLVYSGSTPEFQSPKLVDVEESSDDVPQKIPLIGGLPFEFTPAPVLSWNVTGDGRASINSPEYDGPEFNIYAVKVAPYGSVTAAFTYSLSRGWQEDGGSATLGLNGSVTGGPYYLTGVPVLPVYTDLTLQANLAATLSLAGISNSNLQWSGDVRFAPALVGTVGVGVSGLLNGEASLTVGTTLDVDFLPKQQINELDLSLSGQVTTTILGYTKPWTQFTLTYDFLTKKLSSTGLTFGNSTDHIARPQALVAQAFAGPFRAQEYTELVSRGYLARHALRPAISRPVGHRPITDTAQSITPLAQSVYPWSEPKVVNLGNGLLLGWIRDNPSRTAVNRTEFVTIHQTSNGWSSPAPVWSDGTADFQPTMAVTSHGTIAAWAKAAAPLPDGATLSQTLGSMGIAAATYDSATDAWSNPVRLSKTAYLNRNPMLCAAANGTAMLAWIANSANDPVGSASAPNQIFASQWNGSSWSLPTVIASGIGAVIKADLAYSGTAGLLVYSQDADASLSTTTDRNLYAISWNGTTWSAPSAVTNDTNGNDQPRLLYSANGDLLLFWARQDGIALCTNQNYSQSRTVLQANHSSSLSEFEVAGNRTGQLGIVWEGASADGPDLWSAVYDSTNATWGLPQQLTGDSTLKRSQTTCFDAAGNLAVVFDRVPVNGTTVDDNSVDLCEVSTPITGRLAVGADDLSLSDPNPVPGEPLTVSATIHNVGKLAASNVPVSFYDGDPAAGGTLIATPNVSGTLASGYSTTVSAAWQTPQSQSARTLFVVVDPNHQFPQSDRTNNQASLQYMGPNASVAYVTAERLNPNLVIATARAVNRGGLSTSAGNVVFRIGTSDGPIIGHVSLAALSPRTYADVPLSWTPNGTSMPARGWTIFASYDQAPGQSASTLMAPDPSSPIAMVSSGAASSEGVTLTISIGSTAPSAISVQTASSSADPASWTSVSKYTIARDQSGNLVVTIPVGVGGPYYRALTVSGSYTYYTATAAVSNPPASRLVNISSRGFVGPGSELIAGFYTVGSQPKNILVRGIGPALTTFSVANALAQPRLTLFNLSGATLDTNSSWAGNPTLSDVFTQVGAFALPPTSPDAAIVQNLTAGGYTAQVSTLDTTSGIALVELYDADVAASDSRLINISSRAFVGTGSQNLVAGFYVSGTAPERVLIRAVGPTLARYSVANVLDKPQLTLREINGTGIATNSGWSGSSQLGNSTIGAIIEPATSAIMDTAGAFALATGSADCALVATLPPGGYTAQVAGQNDTSGNALVEIYEVK